MTLKIAFKRFSKRAALKIVGGLLLANIIAFLATDSYVDQKQTKFSVEQETEDGSLIEAGWQVMHWSYSLLEYFRHTNLVEN